MESINRKAMKNLILLFTIFAIVGCSKPIDEPKNLIPKDKMSEMVADFAMADQMSFLNQTGNLETQTRYILKKHNVTAKQFSESYKYYLSSPSSLDKIYDDAQEIIINKDPDAEKYIDKKMEQNKTSAPYLNK